MIKIVLRVEGVFATIRSEASSGATREVSSGGQDPADLGLMRSSR